MSNRRVPSRIILEEVLDTLKSHLPGLEEGYDVKALGGFGSCARGETKRNNDIDLLVEFDRVPTMFEFVRLERSLATLLGVKVDLVMGNALKPEIGKRILSEMVPV